MNHNPPRGWTPGDTYGVVADEPKHGRLRITRSTSGEQVHIELTTEQGNRLAACAMPADLVANLVANGGGIAAVAQLYPAPEPDPTDIDQIRDYFRTVNADLDAECPDPVDDELPDTDIRGAMAGELKRMGLMPEQPDNSSRSDTGDMT